MSKRDLIEQIYPLLSANSGFLVSLESVRSAAEYKNHLDALEVISKFRLEDQRAITECNPWFVKALLGASSTHWVYLSDTFIVQRKFIIKMSCDPLMEHHIIKLWVDLSEKGLCRMEASIESFNAKIAVFATIDLLGTDFWFDPQVFVYSSDKYIDTSQMIESLFQVCFGGTRASSNRMSPSTKLWRMPQTPSAKEAVAN